MAYTPSLSELDAHKGDASLAIGSSGDLAGVLPLAELFDKSTLEGLNKLTDDYVRNKNIKYDQFQKNIAEAYKNSANTQGIYAGDINAIQSKKKDFTKFIVDNPEAFYPDAVIKNKDKFQKLQELEQDYLKSVELSKANAVADKEYRKGLQNPKYNNEVNIKRYEDWKSQPLEERNPILFIESPESDLRKLKSNLTAYKEYGTPQVEPLLDKNGGETGLTSVTNPYKINTDKLYTDLLDHADYYDAYYNEVLPQGIKDEIGLDKNTWIKGKLFSGVPMEGIDKPITKSDVPYGFSNREKMQENSFTNSIIKQDISDNKKEQQRIETEKRAKSETIQKELLKLSDVKEAVESYDKYINSNGGTQIQVPKGVVKGELFDITEKAKSSPLYKNALGKDNLFIQVMPNGEEVMYKIPNSAINSFKQGEGFGGKKLEDYAISKDVLVTDAIGRNGVEKLTKYKELQIDNATPKTEQTQKPNGGDKVYETVVVKTKDGTEMEISTRVPTLTKAETWWLDNGGDVYNDKDPMAVSIYNKAIEFYNKKPDTKQSNTPTKTKKKAKNTYGL